MKSDRRGSWYLLTGVILGVALGLLYSWMVSPVKYVDAPPYALRADYKDDYRVLIASAYLYSSDLLRAEGRLAQLNDTETAQTLALQAQRAQADNHPKQEVQALNALAKALTGGLTPQGTSTPPHGQAAPLPASRGSTSTPLIMESTAGFTVTESATAMPLNTFLQVTTSTPQPAHTPTASPTPGAPFILSETHMLCSSQQQVPLIQLELRDAAGQPVSSREVRVTWDGGEDHFFTGLKPELGLGYGDFAMTPDVAYSIRLVDGEQVVEGLAAPECVADDNTRFWGSWYLVFTQP